MRPAHLIPGDVLMYRNHGFIGMLTAWGEWSGRKGEALEYSHIGVVYDSNSSFEMNPPAARIFSLSEVPWDRVDVYRLDVNGVLPFEASLNIVKAFQQACDLKVQSKEPYNYGKIAGFLGLRILGFIIPGVSRWALSKQNVMPGKHLDICSTAAEEVLEAGIWKVKPGFDLLPAVGVDQAMPSDFPSSPNFKKVSA